MTDARHLRPKTFTTVRGYHLAHVEMGTGDPIVLLHGNPTSSYLWREVMPPLVGLGRVIAPDLIGRGDSDKLPASAGQGRYTLEGAPTICWPRSLQPSMQTAASPSCCTTGAARWASTGPGCIRRGGQAADSELASLSRIN